MNEQWKQLKDTIVDIRDNNEFEHEDVTLMCRFLVNYMDVLEKQMQEPCKMTAEEYRQRMIQAFHNANTDELIALCVLPTEKEFEHLEWLLKTHYKKEPCEDAISRQAVLDKKELVELEDGQSFYCISPEDVEALQPVTPQPKTGHWMIDEDSTDRFFATYECSSCKRAIIVPHDLIKAVYKDYPFCHCGAKMVEPQESEG